MGRYALLTTTALVLVASAGAWAAPTVTNVTATQDAISLVVTIHYDLAEPENQDWPYVTADISFDGGATWAFGDDLTPPKPHPHVSGDVRKNVAAGSGKTITWDSIMDASNVHINNCKVRVNASTCKGYAGPMMTIPSGSFLVGSRSMLQSSNKQDQKRKAMRYITPTDGIWAWMRERKPLMSFNAATAADARAWQRKFKAQICRLLGPTPPRVPLNPEITEETDMGEYVRKRVIFDADPYATVPAYLLVPKGIKPGEKRPAMLAAHGHGWGKIDVCGIGDTEDRKTFIAQLNCDYAQQFARRGYVVIAPDWRGFGERASDGDWTRVGRDPCYVHYLAYGYQGYNLLALQVNDARRAIDYLQTLPEVDPTRIGCCGLSFGGTMTTYVSALDPRVKVACISGYLSTLDDAFSMRGRGNFCGAQYMPGLAKYGDIADVAMLIAPKPLVVEMGEKDSCFVIDDMKKAYARVEQAYRVLGFPDRIASDIHPGEHMWSGRVAYDWFAKWLRL